MDSGSYANWQDLRQVKRRLDYSRSKKRLQKTIKVDQIGLNFVVKVDDCLCYKFSFEGMTLISLN